MHCIQTLNSKYLQYSVLPAILLLALVTSHVLANPAINVDQPTLDKMEKQYGAGALKRIEEWQSLVNTDNSNSDLEKLKKVNDYFNNNIQFVDDIVHWKKEDYWATPVETLCSQAGDCEDFSIAKYFTLKALGVSEEKLLITYVKALKLNQAHMVLTYYETPGAIPLVLDNLNGEILPATERSDLLPVYSFNGGGLWTAKQRGKGKFIGGSDKVKLWKDLESRMGIGG
jgi:predicted transglutaminase-like cysteine proteinase